MKVCANNAASVKWIFWQGEVALEFCAGGYEAVMLPRIGANIIELKYMKNRMNLLRTPESLNVFKKQPEIYGLPVLFLPNRIEDGTFKIKERTYKLNINEPKRNNHIHGFLHTRPWEVERAEVITRECVEIEVCFISTPEVDFFNEFPHEFKFRILYRLSSMGLDQKVVIVNRSSLPMPVGIGFHTCLRVPFKEEEDCHNYKLIASVGARWELDERVLPTGRLMELSETDRMLREGGMQAQGSRISAHFTAKPLEINGREFHGAILTDNKNKINLVYEVGEKFKHWMIWNDSGENGFICAEPQSWVVNAPNVNLSDDITGFSLLAPGESFEEKCKIYISGQYLR